MGLDPCWNNLPKLQKDIEQAFSEIGGNHYTAICLSADGLYHIHDVVTFEQSKRAKAVAKMFGNCHVEEMRGTKEQAQAYINKQGEFEEKGEKVLATFGNIENIQNNSGSRTDLKEFDKIALQDDFDINKYVIENYISETQAQYLERRYIRLLKNKQQKWRPVHVIYVEGKTGSGKTRVAYEKFPNLFKASVDTRTNFPFDNYRGEKVLLLDELRPGVFTPAELFQILDGYPLTLNIKYGNIPALWTTVIIATAMPLDEWFNDKIAKGQDNLRQQFQRRIAEHKIARDNQWFDYVDKDGYMQIPDELSTLFN